MNDDWSLDRLRDFPQLTRFLDLDCSRDADDDDVDPDTKLQRERERRQANNARERYD